MNKTGILEILILIFAMVVLPIASVWLSKKLSRLPKLPQNLEVALYIASLIPVIAAWPLAQIFIPLATAGIFICEFLVGWLIAKLPVKKSLLFSLCFTVIYIVLETIFSYIVISLFLHK